MTAEQFGELTPEPAPMYMLRVGHPMPVWIYTHLAADGAVLYIGATCQPTTRLKQHRQKASWFSQIAEVRYLGPLEQFDGARLEERLIQEHQPAHNRQHRTSAAVQPADLKVAPVAGCGLWPVTDTKTAATK